MCDNRYSLKQSGIESHNRKASLLLSPAEQSPSLTAGTHHRLMQLLSSIPRGHVQPFVQIKSCRRANTLQVRPSRVVRAGSVVGAADNGAYVKETNEGWPREAVILACVLAIGHVCTDIAGSWRSGSCCWGHRRRRPDPHSKAPRGMSPSKISIHTNSML